MVAEQGTVSGGYTQAHMAKEALRTGTDSPMAKTKAKLSWDLFNVLSSCSLAKPTTAAARPAPDHWTTPALCNKN